MMMISSAIEPTDLRHLSRCFSSFLTIKQTDTLRTLEMPKSENG
jgi:hypothetical protein